MVRLALVGGIAYIIFAVVMTLATLSLPVAVWSHIAERLGGL